MLCAGGHEKLGALLAPRAGIAHVAAVSGSLQCLCCTDVLAGSSSCGRSLPSAVVQITSSSNRHPPALYPVEVAGEIQTQCNKATGISLL